MPEVRPLHAILHVYGPAMLCKAIARRYLRSWLPFDFTVVMLDFALALSTASEEPRPRSTFSQKSQSTVLN